MDEAKTISWILLATALASQLTPAKFNEISNIADGINHAIPTDKELQNSISWLVDKKIVIKEGNKYSLSENGKRIIEKAENKSKSVLQIWKEIEVDINNLL